MAYTPKQWVCGETITADGLNNIEEGVQEALDCCGSGGDCGYECTEEMATLFEESVTTTGESGGPYWGDCQYSALIDADEIVATFNGVEYTLPRIEPWGSICYGEIDSQEQIDFSTYPLFIESPYDDYAGGNYIATANAGTYAVKVETLVATINSITPCFKKAVDEVSGGIFFVKARYDNEIGWVLDKTPREVLNARDKGKVVMVGGTGVSSSIPNSCAWVTPQISAFNGEIEMNANLLHFDDYFEDLESEYMNVVNVDPQTSLPSDDNWFLNSYYRKYHVAMTQV